MRPEKILREKILTKVDFMRLFCQG